MRIRSAFVVVLSLAALAAAVQFFVSTPPAAPDASSTDDIDAAPPGIPPAPVLATSPARSCEVAPLTGTGGAQEASPDASVSRPVRRPPPLEPATQAPTSKFDLYYDLRSAADDDLVVLRIRAETKRLSDVDDERAAGYVDLSDSQYAKRREAERAAGGEDLQRRWIDAPD